MKNMYNIATLFLSIISIAFNMISLPNTFNPRIADNDYYESDWEPKAFVTNIELDEGIVSLLYTIQDLDDSQLKAVGITYQSDFDSQGNCESGYSAELIESVEQLEERISFKFNIPNVRVFNPYIEDIEDRIYRMGSVSTSRYLMGSNKINILSFCVLVFCIAYWVIFLIKENKRIDPKDKRRYWIKASLYFFALISASDALICFLTEQKIFYGCMLVLVTAILMIVTQLPILRINYIEKETQSIDVWINKISKILKRIVVVLVFLIILSIVSSLISYNLGHRVYGDKTEYFTISLNSSAHPTKVKCICINNKYYVSCDYITTTFGFDSNYIGGVAEPWKTYMLFGVISDAILTSKCGESYSDTYVGFSDSDINTDDIRVKGYHSYTTYHSYADIQQFTSRIGGTIEINLENKVMNIKKRTNF